MKAESKTSPARVTLDLDVCRDEVHIERVVTVVILVSGGENLTTVCYGGPLTLYKATWFLMPGSLRPWAGTGLPM